MPTTAAIPLTNSDVFDRAKRKARTLGLSLSDYISRLILQDTEAKYKTVKVFPVEHGWGSVPQHIQQQWEKELQEFTAVEKQHPHPAATSAAELVAMLEADESD